MDAAVLEMGGGRTELQGRAAIIEHLLCVSDAAYRLAFHVLGSPEAAEDAVQESYVEALCKVRPEQSLAQVHTWFLTTVVNRAKNLARGEARRKKREAVVTTAREAQTSDTDVERELAGALRATFAGLDTKYRLPLALCYQENMTQRDAAAVLELPERTVSEHINVGLAKLRKALERAGYPAAVAAVLGGLKQTAPAVPASLAGRVEALVAKGVAVQAAAVKGGLAVKWIAGIVLAGAVVAGVAAVSTERRPQASPASAVIYDDQFENAKLASFWQHREPTDCAGTGDGLALRIPRGVGTGSAEMRSRPVKLGAGSLEVLVEHSDYGGNSSWRRNGVELLDETGRTVCALERVVRGRGGYWFAAGEGPRKEIPLSSGVGRSFALRLDRTGRASLLSGNRELAKGRASGGVRAVTIRIYEEMRWGTYMTWRIDRVTVRRLRGGTQ